MTSYTLLWKQLQEKQQITIVGNGWAIFHLHIHPRSVRKWWIFLCKINKRTKFSPVIMFSISYENGKLRKGNKVRKNTPGNWKCICFWIQDTYLNLIPLINFHSFGWLFLMCRYDKVIVIVEFSMVRVDKSKYLFFFRNTFIIKKCHSRILLSAGFLKYYLFCWVPFIYFE